MFRVISLVLILTLCGLMHGAIASAGDPSHGATSFVIVPASGLWHPLGPAKLITAWAGPYTNAGGHPANVYMVFTKEPKKSSKTVHPLPKNVRTYHMLGTDFYYPANATPQFTPTEIGYTADGFSIADKLNSIFPNVAALFPGGIQASSCRSKEANYSFILGSKENAAYLVRWGSPRQVDDVAYLPATLLKGSLDSILDNMSYYEHGGMYEIMRFGALYYYLSRMPLLQSLDISAISRECPDTPVATSKGVSTPDGWLKALESLHKQ